MQYKYEKSAMIADLDKPVHRNKVRSSIVITKDIPLTQIKTPQQRPHGPSSPSPTQIPQFEFAYSRDNSPKERLSRSLMRSRSQSPENYYSSPEKNTRKRKLSRSRNSPQQSSQYRSSNSANPVTAHHISQLIRAEANVPTRTNRFNSDKRQKVSRGGKCLTSNDAIQEMQDKKDEKARLEREKESSKVRKDQEKQKELEQTQIKKINKSRKQCHVCESKQTVKNKSNWIFCFMCHSWCCLGCLPQQFKGACVKTIYKCDECLRED